MAKAKNEVNAEKEIKSLKRKLARVTKQRDGYEREFTESLKWLVDLLKMREDMRCKCRICQAVEEVREGIPNCLGNTA